MIWFFTRNEQIAKAGYLSGLAQVSFDLKRLSAAVAASE